MALVVKGGLLLGVIVLIGAGVTRRGLAPRLVAPDLWRRVRTAAWWGAAAVVVFGVIDLYTSLRAVLGAVSGGLWLDYALESRHGRLTLARVVPVTVLALLTQAPPTVADARSRLGRWSAGVAGNVAWAVAAATLLGLVSAVSHAAAIAGVLPIPADFVHLAAASVWGGAVLAIAFLPLWTAGRRPALLRAMNRLSRVGLAAVATLFATGLYAAQLHVGEPAALLTTPYGAALVTKVTLVAIIVAIAAHNRWRLLPALVRGSGSPERFRRALRIEAVLLLAVLAATAWLTTSPMPH